MTTTALRVRPESVDRTWQEAALLPTLIAVAAVVGIVTSLGAPLVPTIAHHEHVSLGTADWIITGPLVAGAVATPLLGRLADGQRQRAVTLSALGVVVVGCIVSAIAPSFPVMVAGRFAQGFGFGLASVTMAVARRNLPAPRVAAAIGALSVASAAGIGLGYPLTGLVADAFDFHVAYWFGGALAAVTLAVAAAVTPRGPRIAARRFDLAGAVTLCAAVTGITVVISEGDTWGWTSALATTLGGLSVATAAVWVVVELRTVDPLVDLRQIRHRLVLMADTGSFLVNMASYLFVPVVVEFVQVTSSHGYGFGASTVESGLLVVPLSILMIATSRLIPVLTRRLGPRWVVAAGASIYGLGPLLFAFEHGSIVWAFVGTSLAGMGMGLTIGAMPQFLVAAVPPSETGSATGFYGVGRSVGLAMGSAVAAAVLLAHTRPGAQLPDVAGFRWVLLIGAGVCVVAALTTFLLAGNTNPIGLHAVEDGRAGQPELAAALAAADASVLS